MHPSVTGQDAKAEPTTARPDPRRPGADAIDWRAARRAGRACCCPGRPTVVAVMPPSAGRPHPTELLLCGHHYRVSRQALAAAGATVLDLGGRPVTGEAWGPFRAA